MASIKKVEEEEEAKIPVFTVLKNGAILKNIFIVNNSPIPNPNPPPDQENEEILIIGRHPDCNVMLTHPSISRFHLHILSDPSSHSLSVIDLKSIHGTWVGDKRIEPWVRVELKEGDTLRVGGSSRVYRLQWIPLSRAYDFENPRVLASDVLMAEDKEEENAFAEEEDSREVYEDQKSLPIEEEITLESDNFLAGESQEIQSLDSIVEEINSLIFYENLGSISGFNLEERAVTEDENAMDDEYQDEKSLQNENKPVEEKDALEVERKGEEIFESDNSLAAEKGEEIFESEAESQEIKSLDSIEEGINSLPFDEDFGSIVKLTPSAPPMPENLVFTLYDQNEELYESPLKDVGEQNEILSQRDETVNFHLHVEGITLECENPENDVEELSSRGLEKEEADPTAELPGKLRNEIPFLDDHSKTEKLYSPVGEVIGETENKEIGVENLIPEPFCSLFSPFHEGKQEREADHPAYVGLENEDQMVSLNHPVREVSGEIENQEIGIENLIPDPVCSLHFLSHKGKEESFIPEQKLSSVVNLDSLILNEAEHPQSEGFEIEDQMVALNHPVGEIIGEIENQEIGIENLIPDPVCSLHLQSHKGKEESLTPEQKLLSVVNLNSAFLNEAEHPYEGVENEDQIVSLNDHGRKDGPFEYSAPLMTQSVILSLPGDKVFWEFTDDKENQTPQSLFAATCLPQVEKLSFMVDLNSACYSEADHPPSKGIKNNEDQNVFVEDHENKDVQVAYSAPFMTESAKSSFPSKEDLLEITDDKENLTPQCHVSATRLPRVETSSPMMSDKMSSFGSIWSRRGKPASALQIQTGRSGRKTTKRGVHAEVERHNEEDTKDESISKELFSCLNEDEEEIFTPDKENFTPNTLILKSLKKMGKLEEVKHSESCRSFISSNTIRTNVHLEENLSPDKNNQTTRTLKERKSVKPISGHPVLLEQGSMVKKKRRSERVPFQSLTANSASKTISGALGPKMATRSNASVNYTQTMAKKVSSPLSNESVQDYCMRGWIMVVDAATLLDKKSRKSLELLQGLKGTQLIIPRMVLRELDCLKQRGSLFRRKTEASLVLEWIEECMVKTNWWISIQSSEEDRRLTAPTPLAYPQSPFSDGSDGFTCGTRPLLSLGSIMEIVSPTAEDHILDCALLCRKTKSHKQLVVLSDVVTLKIKAMAEGLICEPVKEFRESLVNPFSERFLWTDSSPRGLTWSYLDDVILREKYNRCPSKKSSRGENAKGLKLILLHNTQYGQITPIS